MSKRTRLSRKASKSMFRGGNRTATVNIKPHPMRGGIRL